MSKLSFIASGDRKYIVSRTLSLIKSDIVSRLKNANKVVIKPYCFSPDDQLLSTHVDALESVLEFISPHVSKQITLSAGTEVGNTLDAFKNYDYFKLQDIYDFAIVDLNDDDMIKKVLKQQEIFIPKVLLESDCIISITPPRLSERLQFSAAISNIIDSISSTSNTSSAMKLVKKFSFSKKSSADKNLDLYSPEKLKVILETLCISLSVIDAYSYNKGYNNGGHLNAAHWASSSIDLIANDALACQLLGKNIEDVDYLNALTSNTDSNKDIVVGDDWRQYQRAD